MSVPAEVVVERLCQAAHTVGHARHGLPPHPGWEPRHELLWQIQWILSDAAEQIRADAARHALTQTRWEHVRTFAQAWRP
ncbi:MAG: hypothetical protein ACRDZ4_04265 [Egibacteraceae bacterium]